MYRLLLHWKSGFILFQDHSKAKKCKQADRYTWRNLISTSFNPTFKHTYKRKKKKPGIEKIILLNQLNQLMICHLVYKPFQQPALSQFWTLEKIRKKTSQSGMKSCHQSYHCRGFECLTKPAIQAGVFINLFHTHS